MKIHHSILIAEAAEKIWPFLVEPEYILQWCTPIRQLRRTSEQRTGLKSTFYFEERAIGRLMKLSFVITEWVVNESVAFEMTSGNVVKGYEQRYTIEATPSGSLVTCSEDVKLPYGILGRIGGLFRRSFSESLLRQMLDNLKVQVEASAPSVNAGQ